MFNNPLNLLGFILIIISFILGILPFVRSKLFQRQDILLIIAFLTSGIILSHQRWFREELTQLSILLLTITALFYTIETIRLRAIRE